LTISLQQRFALVIPTLNEADNIKTVLDRTCAALEGSCAEWEVLVVDDDSRDGTQQIVIEYVRNHDRVRLLRRERERGLAGAITHGWSHTNAELLGAMDADLQHPPELLPRLIDQAGAGSDVTIASRYMRPHSMDGWNVVRRLFSRLSITASVPLQRRELRVKDPLSGFFVVRRSCIEGLEFQEKGFKLLLEILVRGNVNVVQEIPFTFAPREHGSSKADWSTAFHYVSLLGRLSMKIVLAKDRSKHRRLKPTTTIPQKPSSELSHISREIAPGTSPNKQSGERTGFK
jgi:dolichol-phosphate mannosyltransferase